MKNNFKFLTSLLLIMTISYFVSAQKKAKPFQGTMIFTVSYSGEGLTPMMKANLPAEVSMSYKESNTRTEYTSSQTSVAYITRYDSLTTTILYDMGVQKFACTISSKEKTQESLKNLLPAKIKYFDSTKVIAGYTCKKAEITSFIKDKETGEIDSSKSVIYYTDDIYIPNSNWNTDFKEIKGVLLEFSDDRNGIISVYTAKEVKKKKLLDSFFLIPSDYQIMTPEEFMGGGGEGE